MKRAYITKRFNRSSQELIALAERICVEYAAQGLDLTLRQLYYQLVARDVIPNRQTEYKRLGSILNDARLAGLIDWNHIVDRTRFLRGLSHWEDPQSIIESAAWSFRTDRWKNQAEYVEVWIEKDALVGVISGPCNDWDVPFFACRGYASVSEVRIAASRLMRREAAGKKTTIVHLGDHDPSGIDMTRDIEGRLALFGSTATIKRVALNMDQVEEYAPPPNPAKTTDSRFSDYSSQYGDDSWELDALDPVTIQGIVTNEITTRLDMATWNADAAYDTSVREMITKVARHWDDVAEYAADLSDD
jgi:hypothetical protein